MEKIVNLKSQKTNSSTKTANTQPEQKEQNPGTELRKRKLDCHIVLYLGTPVGGTDGVVSGGSGVTEGVWTVGASSCGLVGILTG